LHRLIAEFGSGRVTDQGRQTGRAQRDPQDNAIISPQKDMRHVLRRARNTLNAETFSEQRLSRVGYLSPLDASVIRVVERGIKK
jgi:hypothetical protein